MPGSGKKLLNSYLIISTSHSFGCHGLVLRLREQYKMRIFREHGRKHEPSASHSTTTMSLERTGKRKRSDIEKSSKHGGLENDLKFKEFLEVMQPKSMSKIWGNGDLVSFSQDVGVQASQLDFVGVEGSAGEYEDIPARKKGPGSSNTMARDVDYNRHQSPLMDRMQLGDGELYNTADEGATGISDAEWLRSKTSRLLDLMDDVESRLARVSEIGNTKRDTKKTNEVDEEEEEEKEDNQAEEANEERSGQSNHAKPETEQAIHAISQSGRLFLRNLSYSSTEGDLRQYFAPYGDLEEVHLPVDNKTHLSKGFAYILYKNPQHAVQAYQSLDRKIFQGRLLHILAASPKREHKLDEYAISQLPLKKQREIKRKATAASSTFNWNSMYMNADAVISSVADRLGVSKAELLDPTSSDAAVRQAHAETHVIQDTKAYFSQHGMDLKAFEKREKDDKTILFKNFPYGTRTEDIHNLVEPFGKTARMLMPPAGTIAVVEFIDAPAARAAFANPTPKIVDAPKIPAAVALGKDPKVSATDLLLPAHTSTATDEAEAGTSTLFVQNLNFTTTTAKLTELFKPINGFLSARVKTKPDPKNPGGTLSMGFGFAEFRSKTDGMAAMAALNGYVLDGHKLSIKPSQKHTSPSSSQEKSIAKRTKIIIKNLPFEASKRELRALFSAYGTLRSVRVPKKFGGATRGFGFADFATAREAQGAMDALKDTHLLGRRLVLEFAEGGAEGAEEEIERMQKKVAEQSGVVEVARLREGRRRRGGDLKDGGEV
ncbi:unnamed protein product [Tuber melanosporum]|uniref:Multiple RNA-binding domain-containing protein 1 n=1 Tax=Tuber melanosporum (strain Mel28) TaxID=656061 RepID=D5G672_TUBMM|nr:uncharacterized protein GSTUM_00001640001 [Tuber melanosporum]CAZ80015.1 unnamed protein product [Tuber melanosporum]